MIIPKIPSMATINPWYLEAMSPAAPDGVVPVGLGEGDVAGDPNCGNTVMESFWFPDSQCLATPQM